VNERILTPLEHRIARLVVEGLGNKPIAASLGVSHNTVKFRLRMMFDKSGMDSRLEFSIWYLHHFSRFSLGKISR
jgi:DNA-binding NarL/FixJ family response regulator